MRRLLSITATLILVFGLLIAAMRGIGYAKPLPPALAEFQSENCPLLSCWHGIRLGAKNEDALRVLSSEKSLVVTQPDSHKVCWRWYGVGDDSWQGGSCYQEYFGDTTGASFQLSYPEGEFRLHDAMILFGMPSAAVYCHNMGTVYIWNASVRKSVYIGVEIKDLQQYLSPDSQIRFMSFFEKEDNVPYFKGVRWSGFGQWKQMPEYCP